MTTDAGPGAASGTDSASAASLSPSPSTALAADAADAAAGADAAGVASAPAGESVRATIARLDVDSVLASQADLVKKHFGDAKGPFLVQRLALAAGRRMILVSSRDESDPMVLALEGDRLLWSKERPTAGMIPPAVHLAITAHPSGGATFFAYDAPTKVVAARIWDPEGGPFADFQVMKVDACDDLSAAYWPTRGWVATCAWLGGARAQLLREDGTMAWRRDGVDVGAPWRAPAPLSIAFDGDAALVLVQYGDVRPGPVGDHVIATRYDARGRPQWASPVDLGVVPAVADTRDRVVVQSASGGRPVRAAVGRVEVEMDARGLSGRPKHGLEP